MKQRVNNVDFPASSLTPEEQRELVQRVADSRTFSTSETLRSFLLYAAEHSRTGNFEALKEQQIGSEVLGRRPDYNPGEDNIVRVRARQLRQRLEEYFNSEGANEGCVISIPKGHYVLAFNPRAANTAGSVKLNADNALPTTTIIDETHRGTEVSTVPVPRSYIKVALPWTVAMCAMLIAAWLWWSGRGASSSTPDREITAVDRNLWSPFFAAPDREVRVITADSGVALWQDLTHRTLTLGDYITRAYMQQPVDNPALREIAARRYTSPADTRISLRVAEIARTLGGRAKILFARATDMSDIRSGNLVLLGSRRSNPWVELFEPRMNFVLDVSPGSSGPRFKNRSPKPGEQASFQIAGTYLVVQGAENKATESYALAALVPNSTEGSRVLVLEGLNMEGTEAAAEFVTSSDKFAVFLKKIGLSDSSRLKSFEVLLKLTAVGGGYANPDLIAYRYSVQ